MNDSNKAEFQAILNATFEMYVKYQPDATVVRMYFSALNRFSLDDVKQGINLHVQNTEQGQYLPKPADIIRGISGNTSTRSESAWTKVDKAIRQIGPNRTVVFDDPIIHIVIFDMGGWVSLCNTGEKEYPFKHNEFVNRYKGYADRPVKQAPAKLIGIEEAYNSRNGYQGKDQPILIGDKSSATKVFLGGFVDKEKLFHTVDENTLLQLENKNDS